MRFKYLSYFSCALLLTFGSLSAMPVLKKEITIKQSDGTTFVAAPYGDEWNNGYETIDGYTILYDSATENWVYAERSSNGNLIPSKKIVGKHKPDVQPHLRAKSSVPLSLPVLAENTTPAAPPVSATGNHRVLVILTKFTDRNLMTTEADWDSKLFAGGFSTVNHYYNEVSYGKLNMVPAQETCGTPNNGIAIANLGYAHPNTGGNTGDTNRQLTKDALIAVNGCVDFASFDTNSDGYISTDELHIVIIVAGYEASYGGDAACTPNVWGHRWSLGWGSVTAPVLDGKIIGDYSGKGGYTQFGEWHCSTWDTPGHIATIGIIVHELGHDLWLPDEYDTDGSSSGIGDWGVMGGGSWNFCSGGYSGNCPSHPTVWDKWYLGWLTPFQITSLQSVNIPDITTNQTAYYLGNNPGGVDWSFGSNSGTGEYFIVENRQLNSYNAGLPGSGLLIWHIWEGAPYDNSANQNEAGRRLIDLREADGLNQLDAGGFSDSGDVFPGSTGNTAFDNGTNPSSKFYCPSGTGFCDPSCVSVKNISPSQPTMTATMSAQDCPSGGPPNDMCINAKTITSDSYTESISIANSSIESTDPPVTCGNGSKSRSVWYKYTPSKSGLLTVNTFGSNYNTILSVYTGTCSSFTPLFCNDDAGGSQSQLIFTVISGTTYYFMVTSHSGAEGTLKFNLNLTPSMDGILSVSPSSEFEVSGNNGGPFKPSSKTYILTNIGDLQLNWKATKTTSWIDLSPAEGTLGDGESVYVSVGINADANNLQPGIYSDTITFTNITNGNGNTIRKVTLTVNSGANNPPSKPELIEPPDRSTDIPTTYTFVWKKSTDPDGDPLSYELYVCENPDPEKCSPVQISLSKQKIFYAGITTDLIFWILLLIISIIIPFDKRVRKGILILFIIGGLYSTACKKSSEGNTYEYTITGLSSNTTYYWEVIAKDNRGGKTKSESWSFTTGIE